MAIQAQKLCRWCGTTTTSTTTSTTSTTSTTTTSTTTTIVGFSIFNDGNNTITGARVNGFSPVGATFPVTPGNSTSGDVPSSLSATIEVDITFDAPNESIVVFDAFAGTGCQNVTTAGTYSFPGLNGTDVLLVQAQFTTC